MRSRTVPSVLALTLVAACSSSGIERDSNSNVVDSDYAGRSIPKVELKQCDPATEVGPRVKKARIPNFRGGDQRSGSTGFLIVEFEVAETGKTENVIVEETTSDEFMEKAQQAVEKWLFSPATNSGEPVRVSCRQNIPTSTSRSLIDDQSPPNE